MGNKIYVVARGKRPGVYRAWAGNGQAQEQVKGYPGAQYKSFSSVGLAREWYEGVGGTDPRVVNALNALEPRRSGRSSVPLKPGTAVIYTDGGCSGNPGPGGYGCVMLRDGQRKELSGGFSLTTNNRMELLACIVGLEALPKKHDVKLFSDSKYVVYAMTKGWAKKWRARGWMRNETEPAKNPDLWERLLALCEKHTVEFRWVKGHAGTEENERCDALAVEAARRTDLPPDPGYSVDEPRSLFR